MPYSVSRRTILTAALLGRALTLGAAHASAADRIDAAERKLAAIEARIGGRLGVMVLDTGDSTSLAYRATERFPMCSTFKLLLVALTLERIEHGKERLDRVVPYDDRDTAAAGYSPVTSGHLDDGGMSVGDLCKAAIQESDNAAANLLLRSSGGPAAVTEFARSLGDDVTRLDRIEPSLNQATPRDPRDTTSPDTMVRDLLQLLLGDELAEASRRELIVWMDGSRTGAKRLRGGLPSSWRVGDKTGSGDNGTANVVAIIRPPQRAPLLAAIYMTGCSAAGDALDAAHAEIGRLVATTFG